MVVVCLAALAATCAWDRDTLADEALAKKDVLRIIVGEFERNPPLYYQMRIDRVAKEVQAKPKDLGLYDDLGVANDRLGNQDEAIVWMAKKAKAMEVGKPTDNDRYRYHANLGTFYAHRWFARGADRGKLADLMLGIDHLKEALTINPDAHFGREEYQLAILEWVLSGPKNETGVTSAGIDISPLGDYLQTRGLLKKPKAIEGLSGLIRLGNAWESVDTFAALSDALKAQRFGNVGKAAKLRCLELFTAGKSSLSSWKPETNDAMEGGPLGENRSLTISEFRRLRAESDAWHNKRTSFMISRLKQGLHPDTHAEFWNGYDQERFEVRDLPFYKKWEAGTWFIAVFGTCSLSTVLLAIYLLRRKTS